MNKKFFTLVALLGLFVSFGVNAQIATNTFPMKSGNYYFMKTTDVGGDARFLSIGGNKPDSLVAYKEAKLNSVGDSALWKVVFELDNTTGIYAYTITNKVSGTQLSFNVKATTPVVATPAYATSKTGKMGGALKFSFGARANFDPLATTDQDRMPFYSYIAAEDSTLQLWSYESVAAADGGIPVGFMKTKGEARTTVSSSASTSLNISFRKPDARYLTAAELNVKQKNGFQLFAYYNNGAITTNNPLSGILFWADGAAGDGTDTAVTLKAISMNQKKNKAGQFVSQYASLDSLSYSATSNLPDDGSRMTFKVDTLPTNGAGTLIFGDTTKFSFLFDPSYDNDSVIVCVNQKINPSAGTAPRTFTISTGSNNDDPTAGDWVAVQVDKLAGTSIDHYILTTSSTTTPNKPTRIGFKGTAIPNVLNINQIYAVKNANKAVNFKSMTGGVTAGRYYGVDLSNTDNSHEAAYDQVPATQFVYDGWKLMNRENADVSLGAIYKVKDSELYTNGTDTFAIEVLNKVDPKDTKVGYYNISDVDIVNKGYTFDYIYSMLEGKSITSKIVGTDTLVIAGEEKMLFKFVKYNDINAFGPESIEDGAVQLKRQAYQLVSRDGNWVVDLPAITTPPSAQQNKLIIKKAIYDNSGKLTNGTAFFFREVETAKAYILTTVLGLKPYYGKYNVNSTTARLEIVNVSLSNNAFAINDEFAAPYVLDAKGHYNFMTPRGEGLAANANMFAAYRKVGELKADEYTEDDFKLYVDTAKVAGSETAPQYYILKGATAGENAALEGNFLRVLNDSIGKVDYTVRVENNDYPRLRFVSAKREAPGDSLLLNYEVDPAKHVKADSIGYKGKAPAAQVNQFRFKIKYSAADNSVVKLESCVAPGITSNVGSTTGTGYVAVLNNVIYLSKDENSAMLVNMTQTEAPTGNEGVAVESGVKVYVADGAVIVSGAAGKVVAINNVLGQMVAKKTASSDYETFAAPAGILFVVVDGQTFKVSL